MIAARQCYEFLRRLDEIESVMKFNVVEQLTLRILLDPSSTDIEIVPGYTETLWEFDRASGLDITTEGHVGGNKVRRASGYYDVAYANGIKDLGRE